MRNFAILLIGCVTLVLIHCGKKTAQEEPVDKPLVEVDVPAPEWEASIVLVNAEESSDETPAADSRLFETLSRSKQLRVYHPSAAAIPRSETRPDYILEYDIEASGGTASRFILTDADRDTLWEGESDESILTAIEEAGVTVASAVGQSLPERSPDASLTQLSPDLMNTYLEAEADLARQTEASNESAVEKFKDILKAAPDYAPAAVGLAEAYFNVIDRGWDRNLVWLRLAQDAALNALRIDPASASSHAMLGRVYMKRGDYKQAEQSFRNALDTNPSLEKAWVGLGDVFSHYGLYEPSLAVYGNALALNPSNARIALSRTMILVGLNRYDEAEHEINRLIRLYIEDRHYFSFKALVKFYQGDLEAAFDLVRIGLESEEYRVFSYAVRGMIFAKKGYLDSALRDLEVELKPNVGTDASLATAVAAIYALLGQNGSAVQWLRNAVDMGYREYPWLANDPNFNSLKDDLRFQELMTNLKTEWEANMRQYAAL